MRVIGITGGAGSGKSEVLKILQNDFGAHVIMADEVARHLSEKGQICFENIVRAFGPSVIGPDGELDRGALAAVIFNDDAKRRLLNEQTHPYVRTAILKEIESVKRADTASCIVIEAALLIEAGYETVCDELWFVYTDVAIRRERLRMTRNYSDEKIDAVMASQLDDDTFRAHCRRIIINNTTLEDVRTQLAAIFAT